MGTLTHCMTSVGLSDREKAILKEAAAENQKINGDQGPSGALRAAVDYFREVENERFSLAEQIASQGGEATPPAATLSDLAKDNDALKSFLRPDDEARFSRLATRIPTAKKGVQIDPEADILVTDFDTLKTTPDHLEKAVNAITQQPGYQDIQGTPVEKAEAAVSRFKDNLLWLYDQVPEPVRERSKKWYDGASKIAEDWGKKYDLKKSQASGILATLSPQKDWFMNVTMGERIMDIMKGKQGHLFDKKMEGAAFQFLSSDFAKEMKGEEAKIKTAFEQAKKLTLAQALATKDPMVAGVWIRAYDEAYHSPAHAIVRPEGEFGGPVKTAKGEDATRAWGNMEGIGKAASIFMDGSAQNISKNIGREHKVRNFYNNIFDPKDARFVTIDTHAVAADLLRPLSGTSGAVTDNFGKAGESTFTGMAGTYPLHYEAYQRAAKERGILPREMQSVTWEAVRGLFPETMKSMSSKAAKASEDQMNDFDRIWDQVGQGKLSVDEARGQILELAGGRIHSPDWFNEQGDATEGQEKTYRQERPSFRGEVVTFEVAPNPNDAKRKADWLDVSASDREAITYDMAFKTASKVIGFINKATAKGELVQHVGGYLEDTNTSMSIQMYKYASMSDIKKTARYLGYALDQDSVMVTSPSPFKGGTEYGFVQIGNVPDEDAARVYNELRAKLGEDVIQGHTTRGGNMLILVDPSAASAENLAKQAANVLEGEHQVWDGTTYVEWVSKGEDDYGFQVHGEGRPEEDGPDAPVLGFLRELRGATVGERDQRVADAKNERAFTGNRQGERGGPPPGDDAAEGTEVEVTDRPAFKAGRPVSSELDEFTSSAMSKVAVQALVKDISQGWTGSPKVEVVDAPADLPVDAPEDARGLFYKGRVYLVAGNLHGQEEAATVLLHETAGHAGLRGMLGKQIDPVMRHIYLSNRRVRTQADSMMHSFRDADGTDMGIEEATEEVLADMAGTGKIQELKGWDRLVSTIKSWLRDHGMGFLSWSDEDVIDLLAKAKKRIEEGGNEESGNSGKQRENAGRFSRSPPAQPAAFDAPEPTRLDDFIYLMQDKHIDTKRVVEAIRKRSGQVNDALDPRLRETLFSGRVDKKIADFLNAELRPLLQDMDLRKVDLGEFQDYLWNRHAESRNKQIAKINPQMPDGGSGIKTMDARKYLAKLSPQKKSTFQALAQKVDAMVMETEDFLVDTGQETQDTIDAWRAAYPDYVPLFRDEINEVTGAGTGQGFSVRGDFSKRAMGSSKAATNILAHIAMARERAIFRAEKARMGQAVLGLALTNPNPDFWEVDVAPKVRAVVEKNGQEQVIDRVNPLFRNQPNVLHTRINGRDHYVVFNEKNERAMRMATAMKNLDADQLGFALTQFGKVTRWFASINTQYNPVFGAVNFTRDFQAAMLNLSSTPLSGEKAKIAHYSIDSLRGGVLTKRKGLFEAIQDQRQGKPTNSSNAWAAWYERFENAGGKTGFTSMIGNADERSKKIVKEIKSLHRHPAIKLGGEILGWLSDYNETAENAVRLAAFRVGVEKGMTDERAAQVAKELTVNFNRKGQIASHANVLYAFFNASMQGSGRMAENLLELQGGNDFKNVRLSAKGKQIVTGGLLLGVAQAVMLAAMGMGGDDGPPEFVKQRNLVIPGKDGNYATIPMPLGYHVLVNLGRIPTEMVIGGFKNKWDKMTDFLVVMMDAFNPVGSATILQSLSPTFADPIAALAENKDWTGKEIYREDYSKLKPTPGFTRTKDSATPWSKWLSETINTVTGGGKNRPGGISPTPDQIDYLIGQATGGVGREFGKAVTTVDSERTGEDLPVHKVPFSGRFMGTTQGQDAQAPKFYKTLERINLHDAEIKDMRDQEKSDDEVFAYIQDNPEARLIPMAKATEGELRKLRKLKRQALDAGEKERVKLIEGRMKAAMTDFNARADKIRSLKDSEIPAESEEAETAE